MTAEEALDTLRKVGFSDKAISKRLEVAPFTVGAWRAKRFEPRPPVRRRLVKLAREALKTWDGVDRTRGRGRRRTPITPEIVSVLGTVTDREVAERFNVSPPTARGWRVKLGIDAKHKGQGPGNTKLTEELFQRLGKEPDYLLARAANVNFQTVRNWRDKYDIAPFKWEVNQQKECPEKLVPLLGTITNAQMARETGISPAVIARWCQERNITPSTRKGSKAFEERVEEKHPGLLEDMKNMTNSDCAALHGLSRERVRQLRDRLDIEGPRERQKEMFSEVVAPLLGTLPDSEISRMFGIAVSAVREGRVQQDLPVKRKRGKHQDKLDLITDRLGTVSDYVLAKEVGLHHNHVCRFRVSLGVEAYGTSPRAEGFERIDRAGVARLFHLGLDDAHIAVAMGFSPSVISMVRLKDLGLKRKRGGQKYVSPDEIDYDQVLALVEDGKSDAEIAIQLNCAWYNIASIRTGAGIYREKGNPRLNPNRRVIDSDD